jgi:hypothetical protein
MKAIIVKEIKTETKDISSPIYREAIMMSGYLEAKDGELPLEQMVMHREKIYEHMRVWNDEKKDFTYYYVNVDHRGLWNDLVKVSDGFINQKIDERVEEWKERIIPRIQEDFYTKGFDSAIRKMKQRPWYERLFNKF